MPERVGNDVTPRLARLRQPGHIGAVGIGTNRALGSRDAVGDLVITSRARGLLNDMADVFRAPSGAHEHAAAPLCREPSPG